MDSAEAADRHPQLAAGDQGGRRQRPQRLLLDGKARLAGEVALAHQLLQKAVVGGAVGEVAAAPHAQRLIQRHLEAVVGLLDVAVLVGFTGGVGRGLHPVVRHESLVALREVMAAGRIQVVHGGRELVGPMLHGHAAQLPQTALQALGQRLKALRKADRDRFDVGVGQHQVVDQMREGETTERHAQVGHVGEVGLGEPTRRMDLLEVDLTLGAMDGAPLLDVALQGPELDRLVAVGMLGAEQVEERLGLQRRVAFQLADDPGPALGEGIRARAMRPRAFELAGEGASLLIFAGGARTHPGAGCRLDLCPPLLTFVQQQRYLGVFLHGVLLFPRRTPPSGHGSQAGAPGRDRQL